MNALNNQQPKLDLDFLDSMFGEECYCDPMTALDYSTEFFNSVAEGFEYIDMFVKNCLSDSVIVTLCDNKGNGESAIRLLSSCENMQQYYGNNELV